ncbi:RNA polymerase sigma factor [Limnoglobus roseus]|uniref:Sigma-70 family RNA polymerase sigma factor n=1 Tax=Limnoglobus roseus TaxID=2598579 RepID=A0A5C1AFL9_9BACT|nr:sigma-70 family RNA polymerase sigma factor [Limnoglobus roseus]QEL16927.1 sigma-70 family RNA polymerase sigma factor [Limnoglobus roseus]
MRPPLPGLWQLRASDPRPDAELVRCVVECRDDRAFESLVARHAPSVWAICRRALPNVADAEDAFQATFLLLLDCGRRFRRPASIDRWLCGVAVRVALNTRVRAAKRRRREAEAAKRKPLASAPPAASEFWEAIAREMDHLPKSERIALLLCGLDEEPRQAVAERLGWSLGTLSARLSRGRKRLAARLREKGLLGAAALAAVEAGAPADLVAATVRAGETALHCGSHESGPVADVIRAVAGGARWRSLTVAGTLFVAVAATVGIGWKRTADSDSTPTGSDPPGRFAQPVPARTLVCPRAGLLLLHTAVLQELDCAPEQQAAVQDFAAALSRADPVRDSLDENPSGDSIPMDRGEWPGDVHGRALTTFADTVLSPSQLARLRQLDLWVLGAGAFAEPDVAAALYLTREQRAAVAGVLSDLQAPKRVAGSPDLLMRVAFADPRTGIVSFRPPGYARPLDQRAAYDRAVAVLSLTQRCKWQQMVGRPPRLDVYRFWDVQDFEKGRGGKLAYIWSAKGVTVTRESLLARRIDAVGELVRDALTRGALFCPPTSLGSAAESVWAWGLAEVKPPR